MIRAQPLPEPLPPIVRSVTLPERVAIRYLAELLGPGRHSRIMEELRKEFGVGTSWYRSVSFDEAQKLLRRHGILAEKAT